MKYDAAGNVELTFEDGGTGDAGDKYTGLDRFGRLVETLWKTGSADQVQSKYGRNRFGGVVWRQDDEAHAQTPSVDTEDNYYWYDGLYQVKERQRGNLTGTPPYTGIDNLQQREDWTYDATVNWAAYADTNPANSQTRTHNKANEITQISAPAVVPSYDPAGNMLTLPRSPGGSTAQYALKWDAWNRLVSVKDGATPVASYTYDGLTRRLTKTIPTSSGPHEIRHFYYNTQWRLVEERVEGASTAVDRQYTWGLRDRWDMLRRKRSVGGSLNETLYVLRDYLDPVTLADAAGNIVERYAYDAFGAVRILAPDYTARTTSSFAWDFLFHSEFLDTDTDVYNYGYRYYSPSLGRWLSRDPIDEEGGLNLYPMVGNNPVLHMDQLGLAWYDYIPLLSTFIHAVQTPKGTKASDYTDQTPSLEDCQLDKEIAIKKCIDALRSERNSFISDWIGHPAVSDGLKSVGAVSAGTIAAVARKLGTRGAVGATVSAGALGLDAAVDAGILIKKAFDIDDGFEEAVRKYCKCPEEPFVNNCNCEEQDESALYSAMT